MCIYNIQVLDISPVRFMEDYKWNFLLLIVDIELFVILRVHLEILCSCLKSFPVSQFVLFSQIQRISFLSYINYTSGHICTYISYGLCIYIYCIHTSLSFHFSNIIQIIKLIFSTNRIYTHFYHILFKMSFKTIEYTFEST